MVKCYYIQDYIEYSGGVLTAAKNSLENRPRLRIAMDIAYEI